MSFTTIRHIAIHTDDHFRMADFYKNAFRHEENYRRNDR